MFQGVETSKVLLLLLVAHANGAEVAVDEKGISLVQRKASMMKGIESKDQSHPHGNKHHHSGGQNHHKDSHSKEDRHQPQQGNPPVSHLSQKQGIICKEIVKAPAGASYKFNPEIPAERMCCDGLAEGKNMWIQWGFKFKCDDHLSEPHQDEHAAKATVEEICPKTCSLLASENEVKDMTNEEAEVPNEDKVPEKEMTEEEAIKAGGNEIPENEEPEKEMTEEEAIEAGGNEIPENEEIPEKEESNGNCKMTDWGKWGKCTKTCASTVGEAAGKQVRYRNVEPLNCARSFEERECANLPCPVDCLMSDWEEWGDCDGECKNEGAKRNRTRTVKQKPLHGGQCCPETTECSDKKEPECGPALTVDHKPCGGEKVKCEPTLWSEWSPCSQTCNTGKSTRSRAIDTPSKCGGAPCLCDFLEVKNCEAVSCVQECELSAWSKWSECPVTCGGAVQTRERHVVTAPAGGAPDCAPLIETKNCGMACCERDCVLSSWDPWSFCSASCYGTMKRMRKVAVTPCGTGKPCDALFESRECNHDCVLPCEVGEWGAWSACSASCGGGSKSRSRNVTQLEANGGKNCPPLYETACCEESNVGCPAGGEPEVAVEPTAPPAPEASDPCKEAPAYSEAACKAAAHEAGLKIGGAGHEFAGDYKTKGCYTYDEGPEVGHVYYGTGGSEDEMKAEPEEPKFRVKGYDHCGGGEFVSKSFNEDEEESTEPEVAIQPTAPPAPEGQKPVVVKPEVAVQPTAPPAEEGTMEVKPKPEVRS